MVCKSCGGSAADLVEAPEPLCWACYSMWFGLLIAEHRVIRRREREALEGYSGMPWLGATPIEAVAAGRLVPEWPPAGQGDENLQTDRRGRSD